MVVTEAVEDPVRNQQSQLASERPPAFARLPAGSVQGDDHVSDDPPALGKREHVGWAILPTKQSVEPTHPPVSDHDDGELAGRARPRQLAGGRRPDDPRGVALSPALG